MNSLEVLKKPYLEVLSCQWTSNLCSCFKERSHSSTGIFVNPIILCLTPLTNMLLSYTEGHSLRLQETHAKVKAPWAVCVCVCVCVCVFASFAHCAHGHGEEEACSVHSWINIQLELSINRIPYTSMIYFKDFYLTRTCELHATWLVYQQSRFRLF